MSPGAPEEDPLDDLLRQAGRRDAPPPDAREQTYLAVRAAWRKAHRDRVRLHHLSIAAALILCVGLGSLLWLPRGARHGDAPAARIATLTGRAVLHTDSGASPIAVTLAAGRQVRNGDVIRSLPGSQLVLQRPGGLRIHLGPDSEVAWVSQDDLRLVQGVVYVDTEGAREVDAFAVLTHAGRIRHVGTRFSVTVDDGRVSVMVRDGLVSIGSSQGERRLSGGQESRISANGEYTTQPLAADAGPWNWMLGDPPRFAIEDRSLREVVREMGDAAGITVVFASLADETTARQMVLHGPALQMSPLSALRATLLTTQFTLHESGVDADGPTRFEVVAR
jgi:hypothetical protein